MNEGSTDGQGEHGGYSWTHQQDQTPEDKTGPHSGKWLNGCVGCRWVLLILFIHSVSDQYVQAYLSFSCACIIMKT